MILFQEKNDTIEKLKAENNFHKGMKNDSGKAYEEMEEIKK